MLTIVTETATTTATDIDGATRTEPTFDGLVFSRGLGTYRVVDSLDDEPAVGAYAGVAPGDVLTLAGPGGEDG